MNMRVPRLSLGTLMFMQELYCMSISATKNTTKTQKTEQVRRANWQAILFWGIVIALFAAAIAMRLYQLGLPFDRDSYDEGVYWQSLRAMGGGHTLYQEIFYS